MQNNDIVGILSYNIFIGIAVATICGSGFFFDLFWPERKESRGVKMAWKISSVLVSFGALADALALTVRTFIIFFWCKFLTVYQVIVARNSAHITGVSPTEAALYFQNNGKPNPVYRHNAYCVASAVILWAGVVGSFASTYIMWKSLAHNDVHGPKSSKYRVGTKGEEASIDMSSAAEGPMGNVAPVGHTNGNAAPVVNPGPYHSTAAQPVSSELPITTTTHVPTPTTTTTTTHAPQI